MYYFSHSDEVWLNASPEGRVAIAGSIFPDGITFDGKTTQNRSLGLAYKLINDFKTAIALGDPSNPQFEPLESTLAWLEHLRKVYDGSDEKV